MMVGPPRPWHGLCLCGPWHGYLQALWEKRQQGTGMNCGEALGGDWADPLALGFPGEAQGYPGHGAAASEVTISWICRTLRPHGQGHLQERDMNIKVIAEW